MIKKGNASPNKDENIQPRTAAKTATSSAMFASLAKRFLIFMPKSEYNLTEH